MYHVVPISRACTAIYLGGNVALHGLIAHCTLINFRKCGLHVFIWITFYNIMYIFMQAYPFFSVVIRDFLSFGYCDALKDGLARTVKVFRNGARTSLLLSTGVPSMQTWPIIRNERCFQLYIVSEYRKSVWPTHTSKGMSHNNNSKGQPCSKTNQECMGI